jgi:hypothetical protein
MFFDALPLWVFFLITIGVVVIAMELGYRVGGFMQRRGASEKESAVSTISGAILGLAAFMLAFTFAIVTERYETKKGLVREDANAIRIAWLRSEFLPEADRAEAAALLRRYLDARLDFVRHRDLAPARVRAAVLETQDIQARLWNMAVVNARRDMNSDVAALYIEALNEMSRIHSLRIALGLQARIPVEIWLVLFGITFLSMISAGYQTAIAESKRSKAQPILAVAFAVVIMLIAALDHPDTGFMQVTQQPLIDVRDAMSAREPVTRSEP